MSRPKKPEEPKKGAPAFIVTFSDMVTLLLTFFVMLLSLAKDQVDDNKFFEGQKSFKAATKSMGITGKLARKESGIAGEGVTEKYKVDEGEDEAEEPPKDPKIEMVKRTVQKLRDQMQINTSQVTGTGNQYTPTSLDFEPGQYKLDQNDIAFLDKYCRSNKEIFEGQPVTLYVVGLAADEATTKSQMKVSAMRAQTVHDYIEKQVNEPAWKIYSWGAGDGGSWSGDTGMASKKTRILINLMDDDD